MRHKKSIDQGEPNGGYAFGLNEKAQHRAPFGHRVLAQGVVDDERLREEMHTPKARRERPRDLTEIFPAY